MRSFVKAVSVVSLMFASLPAWTADTSSKAAEPGDRMSVDMLRQKYWDKGDLDLRVVQNRLYPKALRFEFNLFGGMTSSDPFLAVKQYGTSLSFHFTEYWGLSLVYWKSSTAHSSAWDFLVQSAAKEPVVNPQNSFTAGELAFSPVYGKLSLAGRAIIHYDLHFLGGMGSMNTQGGSYLAPVFGIGQQFYLSKWFALRLDYRYLWYTDQLEGRDRRTASEVLNLGFSLLFG